MKILATVSILLALLIPVGTVSADSVEKEFARATDDMQFVPGIVKVLVYVDSTYDGYGTVCLEYKDAFSCQKGIKEGEKVPFAVPSFKDGEGVYLPEGEEFFACVHVEGTHKENCVTADNDEGDDVIAVHVYSHKITPEYVKGISLEGNGTFEVGTPEELEKLTDDQELQDESGLTAFNDTNTNTDFDKCIGDTIIPCIGDDGTVIYYCNDPRSDNIKGCFPSDNPQEDLAMGQKQLREQEKQQGQEKCEENGNIAPCIDDELGVLYYCDDPRTDQFGTTCMPSPEEWRNFLPSCESIDYAASCVDNGEIVWTCDDPEYNTKKYDTTCVEPKQNDNMFTNLTDFSPN